jgi:hypothetical protein
VGLSRLLKKSGKVLKKSTKAVFKPTRAIVKGIKRNPELTGALVGAGLTFATGGGSLLGSLGGIFGGGAPEPSEPYAPEPIDPGPAPELAPGFDKKTLLLAGGAVAAAVILSRK